MNAVLATADLNTARPARYRSLQTLLLLMVAGSLLSSVWLLPSRVERIRAATERGDQPAIDHELAQAAETPSKPGETRTLVDVALTLGDPERAAAILNRSLSEQPDSLGAMRMLLEVERQRHRMREVAALDERIFARTGEPDSLREAADIYASLGDVPRRTDALQRLNAIGRATPADMTELAHRLSDANAGRSALDLLMAWLEKQPTPLPPEVLSLAAGLSVGQPNATSIAARLGTMVGRAGEEGPLHVLIQTYAERGRPELSLVAGNALGPSMQAQPGVILLLAQLEALQGDYASARRRLEELDRNGQLLPAGLPMLADLALQAGDVETATSLVARLPADQLTEGLPNRLAEAAFARNRTDLLKRLQLAPIAAISPGVGAVVALAQADRPRAESLVHAALAPGGDLADLGPSFGWALRTLGLQHAAIVRLLDEARSGALTDDELTLLLDVASSSPADGRSVLAVLRAQRDTSARAGLAWAVAATRQGDGAEVVLWLRSAASRLPTGGLLDLMLSANERSDTPLAHAMGNALAGRKDLPIGWTPAEVAFLSAASDPLTPGRLRDGLILIGSPATSDAGRGRMIASILARRDYATIAANLKPSPEIEDALRWLARDPVATDRPESVAARFSLLTSIEPRRVLEPLSRLWIVDRQRLLPIYVAALLQSGRVGEAQAMLEAGLQQIAPDRSDAVLYEIMNRIPRSAALPILRVGARSGRPDWVAAFEEGLLRAGNLEELRAEIRARAMAPGLDQGKRQAVAARLAELNDRSGAIALLASMPTGLKPDDPGVQQLVYLWGPRANADAIAWVRDRAVAAPLTDLPKWLEHLAYVGAPRAVIDLVDRQPGVLVDATATRTYAAALVATHATSKLDLSNVASSATTVDALTAIAQLALDVNQPAAAWRAAAWALSKAPMNPTAILLAAQAAASFHRSGEAADLYVKLLATGPQTAEITVDAGDALLSAKRNSAAQTVLEAALARMPASPQTLGDARLKARTLLLLRRPSEATGLLRGWLARHPEHAGLQADLLQARIAADQDKR